IAHKPFQLLPQFLKLPAVLESCSLLELPCPECSCKHFPLPYPVVPILQPWSSLRFRRPFAWHWHVFLPDLDRLKSPSPHKPPWPRFHPRNVPLPHQVEKLCPFAWPLLLNEGRWQVG